MENNNNYYAKSPMMGRKCSGTFYGLKYSNTSKHNTMQITAVSWQTWAIDIYYNDDNQLKFHCVLHQVNDENMPSIEIRDSKVYKIGYHYEIHNCEFHI